MSATFAIVHWATRALYATRSSPIVDRILVRIAAPALSSRPLAISANVCQDLQVSTVASRLTSKEYHQIYSFTL